MPNSLALSDLIGAVSAILDETFEHHHGIFLDKGTSLLETVDALSAEEASRSASGETASIAAHVKHVSFYLDVLEAYMAGNAPARVDWGEIWRTTRVVTSAEWDELRAGLRSRCRRTLEQVRNPDAWDHGVSVGGTIAVAVHTAYHLGAIRQILKAGG